MAKQAPRQLSAAKINKMIAAGAQRHDGYENELTGLGTSSDKATAVTFVADPILNPALLEAIFNGDDLAQKIVGKLPAESLRKGWTVELEDDGEDETDATAQEATIAEIEREQVRLNVREVVQESATWGRLFGGGATILGVLGAGLPHTALKDERARGLEFIESCDRQDLQPYSWYDDGRVEKWRYTPQSLYGGYRKPYIIHESRVILWPGVMTTKRMKARNSGWDLSVLQKCWSVLRASNSKWQSVTHMFQDMSIIVTKMRGLLDALATDDDDEALGQGSISIAKRVALMDRTRSVSRSVALDAGNKDEPSEELQVVERGALTGIDAVLDKDFIRLSAAADMPATVLLGQSPAGMDATGASDLELWYNSCDTYREQVLDTRVERIVRLLAKGIVADTNSITICWPKLAQTSEKEESEIETARSNIVNQQVAAGVLLPEEAALSADAYMPWVKLDKDVRKRVLKQALKDLENPPEVPENAPIEPGGSPDPASPQEPEPGAGAAEDVNQEVEPG